MQRRKVPFVRLLRAKEMKYGVAVDKAGKRWCGFYATTTAIDVSRTGCLGDIGLCMFCRDRVYEGWTCLNDGRDVCIRCVQYPPVERMFVVETNSDEEWASLQKEFFRNANFNHGGRNEGAH